MATPTEVVTFIDQVGPLVVDMCKRRGLPFPEVIIAQACLEGEYGLSELATKANNILGLKSRPSRMPKQIGVYHKLGGEQNPDGTRTESVMEWALFASWTDCIDSYADFIKASWYENLWNGTAKTWKEWLTLIRNDGYATSLEYVQNVSNVIISKGLSERYGFGVKSGYTNSPLVTDTIISPHKDSPRNHPIDYLTIHCVVGQLTAKQLGNIFVNPDRGACSNYGVGTDGSIGLYCDERDRSYCSSSSVNDNRAITIETASDKTSPYAVNDTAYKALIELCVDICHRNGKNRLTWNPSKEETLGTEPEEGEMKLTVHRWYAAKACPGDYLMAKMPEIARIVTARLQESQPVVPETKEPTPSAPVEVKHLYRVYTYPLGSKADAEAQSSAMAAVGINNFTKEIWVNQAGAYGLKENAEACAARLEKAGFRAMIMED